MTLTAEQFAALEAWIQAEAKAAAALMREPNLREGWAEQAKQARETARSKLVAER